MQRSGKRWDCEVPDRISSWDLLERGERGSRVRINERDCGGEMAGPVWELGWVLEGLGFGGWILWLQLFVLGADGSDLIILLGPSEFLRGKLGFMGGFIE